MGRNARWVLLSALLLITCPITSSAQPVDEPVPRTAFEWLNREHRFFRRYLAIVRQASHDYRYDYKTPLLLMPVAMDLCTGYVAPVHDLEERVYAVVRPRMTADQQRQLDLILTDQRSELDVVRSWQQDVRAYETGGRTLEQVAEQIDYLGQLINRHLVLQERHVFPVLSSLPPEEETSLLAALAAGESAVPHPQWRRQYERLLTDMEETITDLGGRIW